MVVRLLHITWPYPNVIAKLICFNQFSLLLYTVMFSFIVFRSVAKLTSLERLDLGQNCFEEVVSETPIIIYLKDTRYGPLSSRGGIL